MGIKNYPNSLYKETVPAIDRTMAKRDPISSAFSQDVTATALDREITANSDWQVDSISFIFSNAVARDYSVKVKNGRKVVANYNNYLWIEAQNYMAEKITLSPGFYNGTDLATQLQTKLNANSVFSGASITFTVTYTASTGLFAITGSTPIKYLNANKSRDFMDSGSIAGHLFGFNVTDTAYALTTSSDTAVFGLNTEASIINQVASTATDHFHDDKHLLSIDQALHLESSVAALTIDYTVVYEEVV